MNPGVADARIHSIFGNKVLWNLLGKGLSEKGFRKYIRRFAARAFFKEEFKALNSLLHDRPIWPIVNGKHTIGQFAPVLNEMLNKYVDHEQKRKPGTVVDLSKCHKEVLKMLLDRLHYTKLKN